MLRLERTIDQARTSVAAGGKVELSQMAAEANLLCREILALPAPEAKTHEIGLKKLLRSLDMLQQSVELELEQGKKRLDALEPSNGDGG